MRHIIYESPYLPFPAAAQEQCPAGPDPRQEPAQHGALRPGGAGGYGSGKPARPAAPVSYTHLDAALSHLGASLRERIKGQDQALEIIEKTILSAHAGLNSPTQPTGCLLYTSHWMYVLQKSRWC